MSMPVTSHKPADIVLSHHAFCRLQIPKGLLRVLAFRRESVELQIENWPRFLKITMDTMQKNRNGCSELTTLKASQIVARTSVALL